MEREDFIRTCSFSCLGIMTAPILFAGCATNKIINASIENDQLVVNLTDFETMKNNEKIYQRYVIVQNEKLQYPICIYRTDEGNYTALLMRCPHQGAELQVFGDRLQCPAHGSVFDNKGVVQQAPADTNLRSFAVAVDGAQLKVTLQ